MVYRYFLTIQEYLDGVKDRPGGFGGSTPRTSFGYGKKPIWNEEIGWFGKKKTGLTLLRVEDIQPSVSKEVYVRNMIVSDYGICARRLGMAQQRGGLMSTLANVEMFSSNPQTARDGMAYTAITEIRALHASQLAAAGFQRLQQEYDSIAADWYEYFHGAEEAEIELDNDILRAELIGRAQARAMWAEMERLRSGGAPS